MRGTSLSIAAIVAVLPVQAEVPRTAGVVVTAKDRETLPIRPADQAVRVTTGSTHATRRVEEVRISKGVLTEKTAGVAEEEYLVRNAAAEARVVLVEQPVRPGWTVDSDPQPVEMAGNLARFRVATPAGTTVQLHVGQRHLETTKIKLVDRTEDQLTLLLRGANGQAALKKLQPVFEAHHAVLALDERIRAIDWEQTQMANEQSRLRENLKALKGTAEERALVTRYTEELSAQEDRLSMLKTQQAALRSERTQADLEFQRRLAAVDIVQTL